MRPVGVWLGCWSVLVDGRCSPRSRKVPRSMIELLRQYLDAAVIGVLGAMSFVMVWCVVERYLYYRRVALERFEHQEELTVMLRKYHPLYVNTHFNHPSEITAEAKLARLRLEPQP